MDSNFDFIKGKIKDKKFLIAKMSETRKNTLIAIIEEIYLNLDWDRFIDKEKIVLLKPNFTNLTYNKGITTSPIFLEAVVEVLSEKCKKIRIIEGNGGSWLFNATEAAKNHGVFDLIKKFGVEWINISELPRIKIKKEINGKIVELELPENIDQLGDLLISLPVFKNHCMTQVTLGIKNLWGLEPNELRMLNHSKMDYYLPLIGDYYKHNLTLIDGTIGLSGNGPMVGNPVEMNTIFGANDPVIADVIGSWIMKVDPKKVSHIVSYAQYYNYEIDEILNSIPTEAEKFRTELKVERVISNYLDLLTFKSKFLAKIAFNSFLTPIIYFFFNVINGKKKSIPPRKLKEEFIKRKLEFDKNLQLNVKLKVI